MGRRSRRKREWNLTPIEIDEDDLESHRLDANPHYTQSYPEKQVFARTNNFVPTSKKAARLNVGEIFKVAPEFAEHTLSSFRWEQLFTDYIGVQKRQEQFDPLRGNSLLITDDSDNVVLAFFSAGESLSTLVVTSSQKAPFSPQATDHSESFDLPFDSFHVVKYFDLKWPIRQITMSPFTTLPYRLFIVRTTSTLHLFKITQQQKDHSGIHIAQIYHLNLAERTLSNNADIDYSMPVHVEMSPFVPTQFLFITNNGYIALIDAADDNVIHEWTVPIPLPKEKPSGNNKVTQTYVSRWASCGFGPSATSFLVATPETVSEWVPDGLSLRMERLIFSTIDPAVSEEDHQKNKKRKRFKKKDRITSFSTVPSGKPGHRLFCFTTLDYVVVIDSSAYKHPIMILPQSLDETCFSLLKFEEVKKDTGDYRITLFSYITQHLSITDFHYDSEPLDIERKLQYNGTYHLQLPQISIHHSPSAQLASVGLAVIPAMPSNSSEINDLGRANNGRYAFLSIYRLFEDGSLRVKYIDFKKQEHLEIDDDAAAVKGQEVELSRYPRFSLEEDSCSSKQLLSLMETARRKALPYVGRVPVSEAELVNVTIGRLKQKVMNYVQSYKDEKPIAGDRKSALSATVRQMPTTRSYRELFKDDEFQKYSTDKLIEFLHQLKEYEKIQFYIHKPNLILPDVGVTEIPYEVYKKDMICSGIMLQNNSLPNTELSNSTLRFLDEDWQVDDTNYADIPFPDVEETILSKNRRVESIEYNQKSEKRVENDHPTTIFPEILTVPVDSIPEPSTVPSINEIATQPVPGAFGSRKKEVPKMKKKKPKVAGFR